MIYTKLEKNDSYMKEIPLTGGIQYRVLMGGISAGIVRSLVECPFEYAKVKRQTG
jgi:hypothetical protein